MKVLITGAAGGLGRAFVTECIKRGFSVYATDINEDGLKQIKEGIKRRFNIEILIHQCDITNNDSITALINDIIARDYEIDMLLNVAGVDYEGGFLNREFNDLKKIIDINILGSMAMTHRVIKNRRQNTPFYLVFISSLASQQPIPLKATYAASKRFLLDFSRALAEELQEANINVLTVCPGGLATNTQVIEAILAQGFFGSITTCNIEKVVSKTITKSLKGKRIYIPGFFNRLTTILNRLIPASLTARILYKRWKHAQKMWLDIS